jgi:peptidoglycan/LPS O-acetylase OafA/YrhL
LSVEEHFYFVVPFLIAFAPRRAALVTIPLVAVAVAAWRGVESRYGVSGLPFGTKRTDICLDHLAWGAWFGLLLASQSGRLWLTQLGRPVTRWGLTAAFVVLLAQVPIPAHKVWFAFIAPALLVSTILAPAASFHGRVLGCQPLAWVGRISYSLYLWQQLFLRAKTPGESAVANPAEWPLAIFQNYPLGIPAAFVVAAVSFYVFEQPIRRRGYRWLTRARIRHRRDTSSPGLPTHTCT